MDKAYKALNGMSKSLSDEELDLQGNVASFVIRVNAVVSTWCRSKDQTHLSKTTKKQSHRIWAQLYDLNTALNPP